MDDKYIQKFIWDTPKHNKAIFSEIKDDITHLLNPTSISRISTIINELQQLGLLPKKHKQALLTNVILGYNKNELNFFSMNSSSLTKNPNLLRDKPQYKKIGFLDAKIKELSEKVALKMSYTSILPDYDYNFPFESHNTSWDNNCTQIESISGVKSYRLSKLAPNRYEEINDNLQKYVNLEKLDDEIKKHATSSSNIINFEAPKDFTEKQIRSYTQIGIVIEELFPRSILLDVQKRCYPFEQPFYNFGRAEMLPIVLCGQDIPNHHELIMHIKNKKTKNL